MSGENKPVANVVNPLVRWFIIGLPLGLLILGGLSFILYFQKRNASDHPASSRYAEMLRKDLNMEDYRHHIDVFNQTIGPRTPDKPGNIEAAESYIKSTLGYDNMGYQVVRLEFEVNAKSLAHIMVELTGKKNPEQVLLVTSRYDGERSENIAALLMMAHALTGTTHRNTIRFAAVYGANEAMLGESSNITEFKLSGPKIDAEDAMKELRAAENKIVVLSDSVNLK